MSNQKLDFFEEAASINTTDFRTLSIINLRIQNITNSTNSTMSANPMEYIEVHFQEGHDVDLRFERLFVEKAKEYGILRELIMCPAKKCKKYYYSWAEQEFRDHVLEQHSEEFHEDQEPTIRITFWMKMGKYFDLCPLIRRFVFNTDLIGDVHTTTNTRRVIIPNINLLIEQMIESYNKADLKTLSIANLVNQNLTGSTNLIRCSDDMEYMEVIFHPHIAPRFKKSFIKIATLYNIFIQWTKCYFNSCNCYYTSFQDKELKDHIATHLTNVGDSPPENEEISLEKMFWMKKGKYYDLSPYIRRYLFESEDS